MMYIIYNIFGKKIKEVHADFIHDEWPASIIDDNTAVISMNKTTSPFIKIKHKISLGIFSTKEVIEERFYRELLFKF